MAEEGTTTTSEAPGLSQTAAGRDLQGLSQTPATPASPEPAQATPDQPAATPESAADSLIGQPESGNGEAGFKYIGDDGQFVPEWSKHLPEDFGDFRNKLARYRNPVELAKALHSANQTISKKGIIPPTPQSTPEELSAYRKQMGVPDKPEGYWEGVDTTIGDGLHFDQNIANQYLQVAHQYNIPKEAMQKLIEVNKQQAEIQLAAEQQRVAETRTVGREQLRQVWRADFDRNMGYAEKGVMLEKGNPNTFGFRDPEVVRIVAGLTRRLGEDVLAGAGPALPQGIHELRQTAMDIIQNPQNKDYQKYRQGDQDVRSRVRRMLEQAESNIRR